MHGTVTSNMAPVATQKRTAAGQEKRAVARQRPRKRVDPAVVAGNGEHFQPGQNSTTGEVHRRGPDLIPRGSIKLLYTTLLNDDGTVARSLAREAAAYKKRKEPLPLRVQLAVSLLKASTSPGAAMALSEQLADRLEGRPTQRVISTIAKRTIFYKSGDRPGWLPEDGSPTPRPEGEERPATKRLRAAAEDVEEMETLDVAGEAPGPEGA